MSTRFFGLQILDDAIQTRWNIIPAEQREGIKNYVITMIIKISSDETEMYGTGKAGGNRETKVFIGKLNLVLVQILKHEWPHNWPTFISDLVGSSRSSESLCENNMAILKLLSEEVFDFSKEQMTTEKVKKLKESLNTEFSSIYHLCEFILEASTRPSLLRQTLSTLQRFLTWIPLGFIFQTSLIATLLNKFFADPNYRNEALECLTEIGNLSNLTPQYDTLFQNLFIGFISRLEKVFAPETNLGPIYEAGSDRDQVFVQRLALFFSGFFRSHLNVLESPEHNNILQSGMFYLVRVSEVPDNEIFKICLEYWHGLTADLYASETKFDPSRNQALQSTNNGSGNDGDDSSPPPSPPSHSQSQPSSFVGNNPQGVRRKGTYNAVMSGVRQCVISRMAKPEEVLIVEDENGDIVRETTKDTDVIAQYKTMKETLVYLTHLNCEDTENIMLLKLSLQVNGSQWGWQNLNTLCWAIGSISGAMTEEEEKRFLVTVIKDLLGLCEMKRGKDNKAVIASNIMYVVGQYPRFLKAHWKFLRTVVNKLFEFMHEVHPGVQDMACDTFLKIALKCKRKFVTLQQGEKVPFICELVESLPSTISDLEPHQVQAFYEAVGCMLSDKGQAVTIDRVSLLSALMELPNRGWRNIMDAANNNVESLVDPSNIKEIIKILKSNTRVCGTVGPLFMNQLNLFFLDMLNVYKVYSERISAAIAAQGAIATKMSLIKQMRSAKKEILRLLSMFIDKSGDPECGPVAVAQGFIPPVLDPILGDYQRNIAGARDPEVLGLFTVVVEKLKMNVVDEVPRIMEAVFECTLQMITTNFEDFPDHRIKFFGFLRAVNSDCFPALFNIPSHHQKLVVDSVVWAFKHTERNISEMGLDILEELLQNVSNTPAVSQGFYQQFLLPLVQHVFAVMTDRLHKSGFKQHVTLLRHMFHLVQSGAVTVPLYELEAGVADPYFGQNANYLNETVSKLLITSFPNLSRPQVKVFVDGLFDLNMDLLTCKTHLRDFLVELREFSEQDNAGLYQEEADAMESVRLEEEKNRRAAIPGMLKPSEIGSAALGGIGGVGGDGEMDDDL
jgi:exportin-1